MQRKGDYKFAKMNNLQLHKNAFKLDFLKWILKIIFLKNIKETTFLKS